jgi:hypothetical protein
MAYTDIDKPTDYFNTVLRSGLYGGSDTAFTVGFQPDWIWDKRRSDTSVHALFDSVRGFGASGKVLYSNINDVEATNALIKSVSSTGFTVTASSDNTGTLVDWCWKKSTVAGFDIIAYQGTGSNLDLSHNLSAIPDWIMIKDRSVDQAWRVYSKSMGFSNRLVLSESGAKSTSALGLDADPTSSVINIGTGTGTTNTSGDNYICYAFKNVQGFSKFGSYTGNGNADGAFIYTGFKPAFFMLKRTNGAEDWVIYDNKRDPINKAERILRSNANTAESTSFFADILSNGFKLRIASEAKVNGSGDTYIYMAFAESPLVTSTGIPTTAR